MDLKRNFHLFPPYEPNINLWTVESKNRIVHTVPSVKLYIVLLKALKSVVYMEAESSSVVLSKQSSQH